MGRGVFSHTSRSRCEGWGTRALQYDARLFAGLHEEGFAMRVYTGSDIRNVAVVGHAHCGKTSLISAMLHAAKMTPSLGRVADGSAVTAYDDEEVARQTTMANAVAFAEW